MLPRTRIRIQERNNGEIKYICERSERYCWQEVALWSLLIVTIPFLLKWFIYGDWEQMYYTTPFEIGKRNKQQSVFDNIEDAKKCIDDYLRETSERDKYNYETKIKKITYLKYP